MSAVEDQARSVVEALLRHAALLARGAPDQDIARAAGELQQTAELYARTVGQEYGWSSPFPAEIYDGEDDTDDPGGEAAVEALDVSAVVVTPTPAADLDAVSSALLHHLEDFFTARLPTGYRAVEVAVLPR
jgi:hypothetical protein